MSDTPRRRRTRRRPRTAPPPPPPLRADEARALAGQLLRELSPHVGDRQAIRAVLLCWLDDHDVTRLGTVCTAAVYLTFADCLTRAPTTDVPPGALTYDVEGETTT